MRDILKKTMAGAMIAAAALAVSACHKSETTNTTENVSMTDMNSEGSMNDTSASDMNGSASGNMSDMNSSDNSMMGSNTSNME